MSAQLQREDERPVKVMQLKQQKENPPITEKQIRAMYAQMGRKPSEAQIRAIMKSLNQ